MKLSIPVKLLLAFYACALAFGVSILFQGCANTTPLTVTTKTEGVTITTVNTAMFAWADWVKGGHGVTQAQVDAVKIAYGQYLDAQLVASNTANAYFTTAANSTNSAQVALTTVLQSATTSQVQLLSLIASFQKGK